MAKDKLRLDSLNRYLYVVNNPVNYVDPSGLIFDNFFKKVKEVVVNVVKGAKDVAVGVYSGVVKTGAEIVYDVGRLLTYVGATVEYPFTGNNIIDRAQNSSLYKGINEWSEDSENFVNDIAMKAVDDKKLYEYGEFGGKAIVFVAGTAKFIKGAKAAYSAGKAFVLGKSVFTIGSGMSVSSGGVATIETAVEIPSISVETAIAAAKAKVLVESGVGLAAMSNSITGGNGTNECGETSDISSNNGNNSTTVREELLNKIKNQKLKNVVNEIYRPNAKVGDGGLAAAIREELSTGELVGGKSHIQKGIERLKNLENIINKQGLDSSDLKIAQELYDDLKSALGGN